MPVITVMFPTAGDATFDENYYVSQHMPLVRKLWSPLGLIDTMVLGGRPGPDGAPPTYLMIALLTFSSMDAINDAAAQHGAELFADVPKFTTIKPVVQFSETL